MQSEREKQRELIQDYLAWREERAGTETDWLSVTEYLRELDADEVEDLRNRNQTADGMICKMLDGEDLHGLADEDWLQRVRHVLAGTVGQVSDVA